MRPDVRRRVIFAMVAFYVVLVGGLTFFGLIKPEEVLVYGLAPTGLSCASLLGVWIVFGTGSLSRRMAAAALAIIFLTTCWHLARQLPSSYVTSSLCLFLCPAMTLGLAAWILRSMGLRIITYSADQGIERTSEPRFLQFSLREILLLPAIVAVVLAVVENLPGPYQAQELAVICVTCLVETLVSLWLCLGKSIRYRALIAIPVIALTALSSYRFEGGAVVGVLAIMGGCTIATLIVVRLCGYRMLVNRKSATPTGIAAENVPCRGTRCYYDGLMPTHLAAPDASPAGSLSAPLLCARHISKAFPGVQALDDVQLELHAGEVLCVVGENGAGKSTLMKIVGGIYTPDAGEIQLEGRTIRLGSVQEAQAAGITLIHQELNLAQSLDVAGNIFLGREPRYAGPLGLLDRRIYADAEQITRRIGLAVSPREPVSRLSIGQQQLVEIARSLSLSSRVLIMDEPTSSLSAQDTERLFAVINDLRRSGVGILYISHRLPEVQQIADRVTVLRDGRNAGELSRAEINHASLVRLMIGRELKQFFVRSHRADNPRSQEPKPSPVPSQRERGFNAPASAPAPQVSMGSADKSLPTLNVRGFRITSTQRRPIDFSIAPGEIVGLAGLVGAGRTELAEALFGIRRPLAGTMSVAGRTVEVRDPADAIEAGLYLVPEDRRLQGLILEQSVRRNISLASLDSLNWLGIVRRGEERALADRMCRQLSVRTASIDKQVGMLSGGNQQKVVLAKWLARLPKLLILDEPTRGVDVGAKREIYALMDELTNSGVGVLMISSDLEEILGMSDRVLVMHEGELAGELARDELSEQSVMNLATGGERGA